MADNDVLKAELETIKKEIDYVLDNTMPEITSIKFGTVNASLMNIHSICKRRIQQIEREQKSS